MLKECKRETCPLHNSIPPDLIAQTYIFFLFLLFSFLFIKDILAHPSKFGKNSLEIGKNKISLNPTLKMLAYSFFLSFVFLLVFSKKLGNSELVKWVKVDICGCKISSADVMYSKVMMVNNTIAYL